MKTKPAIFTGLALAALCLAATGPLRADDGMRHLTVARDGNVAGDADAQPAPFANQSPPPVEKASKLIGMKVKNQNDQTLGTIRDVVFDVPSGRVSYVVVEKAGRTHGTGLYAAVPLSAFTPTADMKQLILNADKNQFQSSHGFAKNYYPPLGNPSYGAQPAAPASDQSAPPPATERQEILIVPVPASPDQNQKLNPDQEPQQQPDQSPESDRDQSNP